MVAAQSGALRIFAVPTVVFSLSYFASSYVYTSTAMPILQKFCLTIIASQEILYSVM